VLLAPCACAQARHPCLGTVVDDADKALAGAAVTLVWSPGDGAPGVADVVQATSDERGRFKADLVVGHAYTAWAIGPARSDGSRLVSEVTDRAAAGRVVELAAWHVARPRRVKVTGFEPWTGGAPPKLQLLPDVRHTYSVALPAAKDGEVELPPAPLTTAGIGLLDDVAHVTQVQPLAPEDDRVAFAGVHDETVKVVDEKDQPVPGAVVERGDWFPGVRDGDGVFEPPTVIASFWLQSGYICPGEADATRADNLGSRGFLPTWDGTHWSIADGPDFQNGSVLQRWGGALITSGTNGSDDGRFYVAMKVFGPTAGLYHYEFAVHDRDNKRGLGAFRIPVCPTARVQGFGFRDLDQDANNDWTANRSGGEISFQTTTNPLRWNMIFNFWFDCDAAPESGNALYLDQYDIGPGALTLTLPGSAPTALDNETLGPGCGVPVPPTLYATGTVARATLGNSTFALASGRNPPGALCGFVVSLVEGTTVLDTGCTLYAASATSVAGPFTAGADGAGVATMPLPVPDEPALEGMHVDFQAANSSPPGALFGHFNLSSGLRVRIGSVTSGCQ
jgi:hypothetical protein